MTDATGIRPSWWYLSVGVVLALAGFALFLYFLFTGASHTTDGLTQLVIPGEAELKLAQPGRYTIFVEKDAVVNGRFYSGSESLGGLTCSVKAGAGGGDIPIRRATASTTYSIGARSGRSVAEFSIKQAGDYHFACQYPPDTKGTEAILAVGTGVVERIFKTVILSLLSMFGGVSACGIVILIVLLSREKSKKELAARQGS